MGNTLVLNLKAGYKIIRIRPQQLNLNPATNSYSPWLEIDFQNGNNLR